MTKTDDKVDAILAKHPHLTKDEAMKILKDKNERKKKKRADKQERTNAKILKGEEKRQKKSAWSES
jgi:hypothetical protein